GELVTRDARAYARGTIARRGCVRIELQGFLIVLDSQRQLTATLLAGRAREQCQNLVQRGRALQALGRDGVIRLDLECEIECCLRRGRLTSFERSIALLELRSQRGLREIGSFL